jgi:hypothetical protein
VFVLLLLCSRAVQLIRERATEICIRLLEAVHESENAIRMWAKGHV